MKCARCLARQRKIVAFLCRRGEGRLCLAAKARLAKMETPEATK